MLNFPLPKQMLKKHQMHHSFKDHKIKNGETYDKHAKIAHISSSLIKKFILEQFAIYFYHNSCFKHTIEINFVGSQKNYF